MNLNPFKYAPKQFDFEYEVIRTNRKKSASIKIVAGQVQVVIPKTLSKKRLEQLLEKKSGWIQRKLQDQAELPSIPEKRYVSGESFLYLGRDYRLLLIEGSSVALKMRGRRLELGVDPSLSDAERSAWVRGELEAWYLTRADKLLHEKTLLFAEQIGVSPQIVKVKRYKSRWGSCSSRGVVSYNWKIILAPHPVIDYLVVHELCHLLHMNHSAAFWSSVERVMPDYRQHRTWLKQNGIRLTV